MGVGIRSAARALVAAAVPAVTLAIAGSASATDTLYDQTMPVVWVLLVISVAGAFATFAVLVYAIYRFRDPTTRGRRYG